MRCVTVWIFEGCSVAISTKAPGSSLLYRSNKKGPSLTVTLGDLSSRIYEEQICKRRSKRTSFKLVEGMSAIVEGTSVSQLVPRALLTRSRLPLTLFTQLDNQPTTHQQPQPGGRSRKIKTFAVHRNQPSGGEGSPLGFLTCHRAADPLLGQLWFISCQLIIVIMF